MERNDALLRRRFARSAVAAGCALAALSLGAGTAGAAERAFELVTPVDSLADIETTGGFTTDSGDLVVFTSAESLAGAIPNGPFPTLDSYTARRSPTGWWTEWTTDSSDEPGTIGSRAVYSTDDGMRQLIQTENRIDPADDFAHSNDPYLRVRAPDGSRSLTWLAPGPRTGVGTRAAVAVTSDLTKALVTTPVSMVPEDVDTLDDLYIVGEGAPTLVTPDTPAVGDTQTAGRKALPGAVAPDMSYVYFRTTSRIDPSDVDTVSDVYRWDSDGTVRLISPIRRTLPLGTNYAATAFAFSADGDKACFVTRTRLLDGDEDNADDVYCYTVSSDTLERASIGPIDNGTTAVRGVGMSADGSSVFFSTDLQLVAEDLDAGQSLYLRREGTTSYVAALDPTDTALPRRVASSAVAQRSLRIAPDGESAIFTIAAPALPTIDRDTSPDVYRWTLAGGLQLISAGGGAGEAHLGAAPTTFDNALSEDAITGRAVTDDGETIFFDSSAALVPEDTDGGFVDVYEWNADTGVSLVSAPGDARYDSLYMDSSADGGTVFLITAEAILPQDINSTRDLYAARAGGGFALPEAPQPCAGDACQGKLPESPKPSEPGSQRFEGGGDAEDPEPAEARHGLLKLDARQRRAFARNGRTTIRVRVSGPGMVAATASARLGRRNVKVAEAWRRATRRGTVRLTLALNRRARTQLRRGKALRLTIAVAYSASDDAVSRVVVLRG
jgi:hypothetical protein